MESLTARPKCVNSLIHDTPVMSLVEQLFFAKLRLAMASAATHKVIDEGLKKSEYLHMLTALQLLGVFAYRLG